MTYYRVSLQGTLGSQENYSINPSFATSYPGTPSVEELQAAADAIAAVNVPTALADLKSNRAPLTVVRVEARSDTHVLELAAEAPYTGSQSSNVQPAAPPQTALVFSLRTNRPGASGRGRLYWPALANALDSTTLRLPASTVNGIVAGAATYLRAIQDALKAGISPAPAASTFELAVFSKTAGGHQLVNRIMVGDVLDTQRRRRDRLPEAYKTAPFPA